MNGEAAASPTTEGRHEMWFWWWLIFVTVLFLIPVSYGWGYRGWGPPYPYLYRRGRIRAVRPYAATSSPTGDTARASGEWGWVADVIWMVFVIAAVWLLIGLFW
jgi:hypothetical protein